MRSNGQAFNPGNQEPVATLLCSVFNFCGFILHLFPIRSIPPSTARPAKDFESWETVSIVEARSVAFPEPRRKCTGFLVENGASGISDIEGKTARVAAMECGQRQSFNSRDRLCRLDCARTQANKDSAATLKIARPTRS